MDVDTEVVPVSVTVDLTDPTSTDGRDLQSEVSSVLPPDGASELPGKKRRRVMFADE